MKSSLSLSFLLVPIRANQLEVRIFSLAKLEKSLEGGGGEPCARDTLCSLNGSITTIVLLWFIQLQRFLLN